MIMLWEVIRRSTQPVIIAWFLALQQMQQEETLIEHWERIIMVEQMPNHHIGHVADFAAVAIAKLN